jgi:hypothetical protein
VLACLGALALGVVAVTAADLLRQRAAAAPVALDWAQLVPPGEPLADPRLLARGVVTHDKLDPNLKASQPRSGDLVRRFDDRRVRISGYVVPIDYDGTRISIFLLVPYAGACIHVPPPPANQIIYVLAKDGFDFRGDQYTPVEVTGTLRVLETTTAFADVGYELRADAVESY